MTNTTYSEFWKQCTTQISPGAVSREAKVSIYIILEAVHYAQVSPGVVSGGSKSEYLYNFGSSALCPGFPWSSEWGQQK